MPQIFRRSTSFVFRFALLAGFILIAGTLLVLGLLNRSSYWTQEKQLRVQPVPFSHKHHVSGLGLDCRYCHTSVENAAFAGMPPTETCLTCHSQVWSNSPLLKPVIESAKSNRPIEWIRVNDLPDFVYFNHAIHVQKGVACVTCHGPVPEMPLTWQGQSLQMEWCLSCHRHPERYTSVSVRKLTDCSTCHR
jgi:hypothetical protein